MHMSLCGLCNQALFKFHFLENICINKLLNNYILTKVKIKLQLNEIHSGNLQAQFENFTASTCDPVSELYAGHLAVNSVTEGRRQEEQAIWSFLQKLFGRNKTFTGIHNQPTYTSYQHKPTQLQFHCIQDNTGNQHKPTQLQFPRIQDTIQLININQPSYSSNIYKTIQAININQPSYSSNIYVQDNTSNQHKPGLGTLFFSVQHVPFFSVLKRERFSVLFSRFWRLIKPKRMLHSFPFFSKERKRTERT